MLLNWRCSRTFLNAEKLVGGHVKKSVTLSFFFQAEDGIRDLVRSRGLGDVYKRQVLVQCIFC